MANDSAKTLTPWSICKMYKWYFEVDMIIASWYHSQTIFSPFWWTISSLCFFNSRFFNYLVTFPTPVVGLFLYWLVDPGSLAKKSWTFNTAIYTLTWQKNSLRYWSNTQQIRLFQILVRIGGVRINWSAITMSEDQVHHTQSCWFDVNDENCRT